MTDLEHWLTAQEAAELSNYHPDHIRRLIRAGKIKARRWGVSWMISRESLLEFLFLSRKHGEKRGPKPNKK